MLLTRIIHYIAIFCSELSPLIIIISIFSTRDEILERVEVRGEVSPPMCCSQRVICNYSLYSQLPETLSSARLTDTSRERKPGVIVSKMHQVVVSLS